MQQHPHQQLGCITHRPLAAAILGNAGCEGRGEVRIQLAEAAVGQARAEQIGEEVGLLLREDLRGVWSSCFRTVLLVLSRTSS